MWNSHAGKHHGWPAPGELGMEREDTSRHTHRTRSRPPPGRRCRCRSPCPRATGRCRGTCVWSQRQTPDRTGEAQGTRGVRGAEQHRPLQSERSSRRASRAPGGQGSLEWPNKSGGHQDRKSLVALQSPTVLGTRIHPKSLELAVLWDEKAVCAVGPGTVTKLSQTQPSLCRALSPCW